MLDALSNAREFIAAHKFMFCAALAFLAVYLVLLASRWTKPPPSAEHLAPDQ